MPKESYKTNNNNNNNNYNNYNNYNNNNKRLLKGLEDLEVGGRVETIQTPALLRKARIVRRVLET